MNLSDLVKQRAGAKPRDAHHCHFEQSEKSFLSRQHSSLVGVRASEVEFPGFVCKSLLLMADQTANLLRELPSIDYLLKHSRCESLLTRYNREYVTQNCRMVIDQTADGNQAKSRRDRRSR